MGERRRNIAASVRQRLLDLARRERQVFDVVLVAFGLERLIYRLSVSEYRDRFVLKGGMLVTLWTEDPGRFTRDVDFLGFGEDDEASLREAFEAILSIDAGDGLVFDTANLTAAPIRDDQVYGGMRLKTVARLGTTRIPITVDIGFGDALAEPGYRIDYQSLLDFPAANIRAYSPETVIAEKFQAVVALGIANSRMKDYYDLWSLPKSVPIDRERMRAALRKTFVRRNTELPVARPSGLSVEFSQDPEKAAQWAAYSEATELDAMSFRSVVDEIWEWIAPICREAADRD